MFRIDLLSIGQSSLVYHLLILLTLEAVGGFALLEWGVTRDVSGGRVARATAGLLVLRILLLAGEQYGPTGGAPLVSGMEVASVALLGWAFLPPSLNQHARMAYLLAGLGTSLLCAIGFLPSWHRTMQRMPALPYGAHWQSPIWFSISMALTLAASLALVFLPRQRWSQRTLVGFTLLFLGSSVLCVSSVLFFAGWLEVDLVAKLVGLGRLLCLLGHPLFAIAIYRAALWDMLAHREQLQAKSEEARRRAQESLFFAETGKIVGESLDLGIVLRRVVERSATALGADRSAFFLSSPDDSSTVQLAAQYPPRDRAELTTQEALVPGGQPRLEYVLRRGRQLVLNTGTNNPRLQALYRHLGSQVAGPTIIQPVLGKGCVLGVLVVGNDLGQERFAADKARLCRDFAAHVASAIQNASLHQQIQAQLLDGAKQPAQESPNRLAAAILERSADPTIVADGEGRIVVANAAAEDILGASRESG